MQDGATKAVAPSERKAKPARVARRSQGRWASIRANIGRNHPDYGLSPSDHDAEKQARAHRLTRRPAY